MYLKTNYEKKAEEEMEVHDRQRTDSKQRKYSTFSIWKDKDGFQVVFPSTKQSPSQSWLSMQVNMFQRWPLSFL